MPARACAPGRSVRTYPTVEHYFQASKALDRDAHDRIANYPTPHDAKRAGRRAALRPDWEEVKEDVMTTALRAKFSAEPLRSKLLATGQRPIIEESRPDPGRGARRDGERWHGANRLGILLMQVRDELAARARHRRRAAQPDAMSDGRSDDVIQALRRGKPAFFCRIHPAARLPDIAASGGLLSCASRIERSDRWGNNAYLGEHFGCCSFMPHWGVFDHFRDEESALLLFDAAWLAALPGARLSPHNTATADARSYLAGDSTTTLDTLRHCRSNPRDAEVLVPEAVPLDGLRYVVFCDGDARGAWWRVIAPALPATAQARVNGDLGGYRLPNDLNITTRHRPALPGLDRRRGLALHTSPVPVDGTVDLEDVLDEWDDEASDEPADVFDTLYAGPRDFADFVDWPLDDDESLYADD